MLVFQGVLSQMIQQMQTLQPREVHLSEDLKVLAQVLRMNLSQVPHSVLLMKLKAGF